MLQHCQVAGPDQRIEEATAVGKQRDSFAPGVVRGEEGEAMTVSGLSCLLTENSWSFKWPARQYHLPLCK